MKKIFAFVSALFLSVSAHAAQFTEGTHYKVLDTKASKTPVVTEYFSFFCPHCYDFEPVMKQVKSSIPENARFQKAHPSFMGGAMGEPMAKAYATIVVLKLDDSIGDDIFNRVHRLDKAPRTEAELRQIFLDHGVDAKKFDGAYNGFAVDSMQKRFDRDFKAAGLRGVPSVIVNNKYLLTPGKSLNSIDEYIELINFLLKK